MRKVPCESRHGVSTTNFHLVVNSSIADSRDVQLTETSMGSSVALVLTWSE